MTANYTDAGLRSGFMAEQKRITAMISHCEDLDADLQGQINSMRDSAKRVKGVSSLMVRLTEQVISNRNLKMQLVKQLTAVKRDIIEREIKLTTLADDSQAAGGQAATSIATLKALQDLLIRPNSLAAILEMPETKTEVEPEPIKAPAQSVDNLPTEIALGDTICNEDGTLWVVTEDGADPADTHAAEIFPNADIPYAITLSGVYVLMVTIEA